MNPKRLEDAEYTVFYSCEEGCVVSMVPVIYLHPSNTLPSINSRLLMVSHSFPSLGKYYKRSFTKDISYFLWCFDHPMLALFLDRKYVILLSE